MGSSDRNLTGVKLTLAVCLSLHAAYQSPLQDIWRISLSDDSLLCRVNRPLDGPELCPAEGRRGGSETDKVPKGPMTRGSGQEM